MLVSAANVSEELRNRAIEIRNSPQKPVSLRESNFCEGCTNELSKYCPCDMTYD